MQMSRDFAMIRLEKPLGVELGLIIGARFDSDINNNSWRLAFYGNIQWIPIPIN